VGPTLPFCRGRLSPSETIATYDIEFSSVFTNPIFYFFTVSNVFQGLAFYLPGIYLAIYASTVSITASKAVLLLAILNLSQVIGQIFVGWLSDCSNIFLLLLISTVGSVVACAFWYAAFGLSYLVIFGIIYGICAGSYTVLFSRFVSSVTPHNSTGLWLYGVFAFQRGIGSVASGPLSAFLLKQMDPENEDDYRSSYRTLILFVGACLVTSSLGGVAYFWRHRAYGPSSSSNSNNG